jgi:large conductance mechanosensitive channel
MSIVKEFKEFAVQGSVMDLAVGIVIGAAFKSIIDSFVADILTPLIGLVTGGYDFANRFITLGPGDFATLEQAKKAGVATLNYGLFINAVINFLIVALVLFVVVKRLNRIRRAEPATPA